MKCFEVTWRDESNDSRAKVDFIFDRFFIKRIGLRFLIQHPGLVAVWQSLKQDHCSDKLSQLLAGHVVPCHTLKPLAIFNGFDDCTAVWTMTMTVMILCLPRFIPYVLTIFGSFWALLSIFGSTKGIILKPQKQLSQPYFQDGDGGRMLVLFCCRVLGKRSSAPRVCLYNLYLYKYFAVLSHALNVLHSYSLRKTRNLLLSGSCFFAFKSGTLCFFRVSLSFRCIGHHSQRGGGRDFACRSTRGAQRCAGGLWPGVTWRFRKVKFLWRIQKSLHNSMQVETRKVVQVEILNRNFEFARKLKADILAYVARYVGSNLPDPGCQTRPFSDQLCTRGHKWRSSEMEQRYPWFMRTRLPRARAYASPTWIKTSTTSLMLLDISRYHFGSLKRYGFW